MPSWRKETTLRRLGLATDYDTGAAHDLYTITGGCLVVTELFAHVTVAGDGTALPQLIFTPTGGGAAVDISGAAAGVAWAINTLLMCNGVAATLLVASIGLAHGATGVEQWAGPMIFTPGVISITNAAGADATLMMDWYLSYRRGCEQTQVVIS